MPNVTPASSTTGFFQTPPKVQNQYREDAALRRSAELFLSSTTRAKVDGDLDRLGDLVLSPKVLDYVVDAEENPPSLRGSGYTMWGASQDANTLVTAPGWKALLQVAREQGIVNTGYEASLSAEGRIVQAIKIYLWCASSAMTACPSGMQDGAVSVIGADLARPPASTYPKEMHATRKAALEAAYARLISKDPEWGWTSGQWMTERRGGSDVKGTETVATWVGLGDRAGNGETDPNGLPLGPYSISGFKWFASATDCGCSLILAYTDKGLSCFYAPTRRLTKSGELVMNGIKIQRLKKKLGTQALPSAELELKDMRGWLVGDEGRGVAVIATVLNVTRFHNAARANGYLGRGLGVARAFARVRTFPSRKAPNNVLRQVPLFCRSLANVTLRHRADTFFTMFLAALLGAENAKVYSTNVVPDQPGDAELLLRLLTSVAKAYNTKHSVHGLQECMEALGGVGYLENNETPELNVARMFRDANVFPIWEGTTDVLSTDTVKVLRGKSGEACTAAMDRWLAQYLKTEGAFGPERAAIAAAWKEALAWPKDKEELFHQARDVVDTIGNIVCATLLIVDAERDGNEVAAECARRFAREHLGVKGPKQAWTEVHKMDQRIAFEADADAGTLERARL